MSEAYGAGLLRVDLSSGKVWVDDVDEAVLRQTIGGYALGARILYDEVPAEVAWADPGNRLMFLGGVLSGTAIPGSGGVCVSARGSMTGGAAGTQAQGDFAAYLRRCGYLGVVVSGASPDWTHLFVDEAGHAELRDARHLVGRDTWQTVDGLVADLGRKERQISVFSIGPAGENLVRWAGVVGNRGHAAMHNGVGAVMGAKKLKAVVAARGRQPVPVRDAAVVRELAEQFMAPVKANERGVHYYGTLNNFQNNYRAGNVPVRNYQTSLWDVPEEQFAKISGPYLNGHFQPRRARPCWACPNHHCTLMTITEGPYAGLEIEEPEYEQLSAFSANLDIAEVGSVAMLGNTVDRLGLDANEAGWICGLVMECFERGVLTAADTGGLEVRWGDAEAARTLLHRIARREGIGDLLAEGVRRAAGAIGGGAEQIGIYTRKGGTPRGHDHRARWAELFDTVVSETGSHETSMVSSVDFEQFGLPARLHPYDPEMIARFEAKMRGGMQLEDSAVTCRFNTRTRIELLARSVSAVTGWKFGFDEALAVGRRAIHTLRAFNLRSGLGSDLEVPSPRYGSTPVDGPAEGLSIEPHLAEMLRIYYEGMGWDERGWPRPGTLRAFGLDGIARDLWGPVE